MAGTRIKKRKEPIRSKGKESVPIKKLRRRMRKRNPRAHAEVVKINKEKYKRPTRAEPRIRTEDY